MDLLDDNVVVVVKHGDGVSVEIGKGSQPEAALIQASRSSRTFIDGSHIHYSSLFYLISLTVLT